jgi:hypothetical protein
MSKREFIQIPKSLFERIIDLTNSILIIRDSLESVKNGKKHHLLNIYNQLRALLAEKSKGNPPLLLDIAKKLSYPLTVYYKQKIDFPEVLKPTFEFQSLDLSIDKTSPHQVECSLEEFLEKEIIVFNGKSYRTQELIKTVSNKAGGSHYPEKLPKEVIELFSIFLYERSPLESHGIPNFQALNQLMIDIASNVLGLGTRLLKTVSEFEIYLQVYFPKQKLDNETYLLDIFHDHLPTRISIVLNKENKFCFNLIDSNNNGTQILIIQETDLAGLFNINFAFGLTNQLKTRIKIEINGKGFFEEDLDFVFTIRNDFESFSTYHNRSKENENAGLSFGMIRFLVYARYLETSERATVISLLSDLSEEDKVPYFTRGNYGTRKINEKNVTMTGVVKLKALKEIE